MSEALGVYRIGNPRPVRLIPICVCVCRVSRGGKISPYVVPSPQRLCNPLLKEHLTFTLRPCHGYFNDFFIFIFFFFLQNGERGYLEGLASRYADLYNTHYRDILEYLDELRAAEWAELSPRITLLAPSSPSRSPCNLAGNQYSHHLYAPGKYSVSINHTKVLIFCNIHLFLTYFNLFYLKLTFQTRFFLHILLNFNV